MDMAVVMQTEVEVYEHVIVFLRGEGFNPVALANPVTGELFYPGVQTYVKVRPVIYIAVPHDERVGAEMHLKKWQAARNKEFKAISAQIRNSAFKGLSVAAVVGVILYFFNKDFGSSLIISTIAGTIVFFGSSVKSNSADDGKE